MTDNRYQRMEHQVFLGGACGATTWRKDIAIPLLEAAGVTYYNPQLGVGEWTPACEAAEMEAKDAAEALVFVMNGATRGVATAAEIGWYMGRGRKLALAITDIGAADLIDGRRPTEAERDDLNRGRIFLRTMAREHSVPVFVEIADAIRHAIELVSARPLTRDRLACILAGVRFRAAEFLIEELSAGFLIQIAMDEPHERTGVPTRFYGRKWFVDPASTLSDVVRTAFLAVATWQEHEAREGFTYRGERVFGPHGKVDTR